MERANKLPHQIPGNMTVASSMYDVMIALQRRRPRQRQSSQQCRCRYRYKRDVASSSTVPGTTYNKQKLEAAAELHTTGPEP